ncbi:MULTISPECIES: fusion protein (includes pXO2-28-29-30) [unclassified Bacillus cereus group]|uniref:fusion protein (includes pXO2-28-29-30) n=1 Tax=unclassified Bacillus cereus group TaxID=2750818 RepID=UPI0011F077AE|nr:MULTISPECIES: fusion protein (includes pXO2-28-29-30) [unclassified Bacillus cereus group]QEL71830.1 fusion protein (includes pXO2-28-29-30) [Bacillus sp. AR4-2]QEL77108.1 fusion protein (includes pXO2-28-29-30) [Bacillus sp. SH8-8]
MWIRRTCNLLLVVIILLGNLVDFVSTGYAESAPSQEQGQEKKTKDVTVLQGKSDMNIMGLSPNEVVVADGKKGSNLFDFEAFIKPSDIVDGTAPFDSNDEAGNDSNPNNGIVRTFDTVTYPLKVTINPKKHDQLKNIKLKITGTLENGITNKRVNAKFAVGGKEDLEKEIVSFDMEYMLKETGNSLMIPVTVEVQGAEQGLKLKPNIKIQVISVDGEDITNENVSQSFNDINPVTASGKVNVKAKFSTHYSGMPRLAYSVFNPKVDKDDRSFIFPVVLSLFVDNLPNRSDIRGATFPVGKVNYHFDFSGRVDWDSQSMGVEKLDFEGKDTPFKIFNYQAIDDVSQKVPQPNTESFELGLESYKDVRTNQSASAKSYIPKEKWNAADIEKYTINSVWDSGITQISKPKVSKEVINYEGNVSDFTIGSTFPTMISHADNVVAFNKNQKAFATTRFLIHTPNEYYPLGKNNKINKANNVYYDLKCIIDSYEDSQGNVVPYNTTATVTINERNNPKGSYSIQTTFHTPEGKELGTPNIGYSAVSKGDPTVIVGQKVKVVSHLNVRAVTEGGTTMVYKWNTDSFYLTKQYAESAKGNMLNEGYPTSTGERIKNSDKQVISFGIAKKNDNSFDALTQNKEGDYEWYNTYDEAIKYGEVGAIKNDINAVMGDGEVVASFIPFDVKTKKVGSVNEKGTPNITVTDSVIYPTADRKVGYRIREDGKYNNFTEYDENGNLTKLQSPVGSTINFETLGIINGETSSDIKTNKNTYYSSDNVDVTVDNLAKLPAEVDFNSLDEKIEMRVKIPKGLDYVVGSAKYGDQYIEPKIEQQGDGSNHLVWYDTLTRNNKALKKINFEARINPVLLPQGNQVGLEIQNVMSSSMDTRLEKFRTSSKNISVVKIGMVGVSETIKKVTGKKNSDYEVGVQPYTTIKDESHVKALTYVPRNKDENGSAFSGITFLKQLTLDNPNNKNVEIWLNNSSVESNNPNKIDLQSNGWYRYTGEQDLSKVVSILLYINDSLSNSDVVKMNLVYGTYQNEFGDQYVSKTVVNTSVDYKLSPVSNQVKYTIVADVNLSLRKIRIDTAPAESGLPVTIRLDKDIVYEDSNKEKLNVNLYDKTDNKVVGSKIYTIEELPEEVKFKVDPKFLKKNNKRNYEVRLEKVNKESILIVDHKGKVDTDGYTSSEETVKANAKESTELKYKGVIMTEREVGKEMEVFYETLTIPLKQLPKQKTGYGFELKTEASYNNELAIPYDLKANALVDKRLVDSYLNYEKKGEQVVIPLEETKKTGSLDKNKADFLFELPHMNVEQKTGNLFTDQQVKENDSRIKNAIKDGKRKLYVPIWANLEEYDVFVASGVPIGANKINFEVTQPLQLYAYMYGTIGSKTLKDDELLIEPVDPKNPFSNGKPSDWSDEDIAWLKKN